MYGGCFVLGCLEKVNAKTLENMARREEKRQGTIGERFQKHTAPEGRPGNFVKMKYYMEVKEKAGIFPAFLNEEILYKKIRAHWLNNALGWCTRRDSNPRPFDS